MVLLMRQQQPTIMKTWQYEEAHDDDDKEGDDDDHDCDVDVF